MSISANAIWQKTGGSDSAGGGFDPSLTANMFADLTCTLGTGNSPVVASASYNFVSHDVGDWLFIGAGTNWLFGWFKIVSVNAGAATLSAAVGTAQSYASGSGHFYLNTVAGVASVATQSANKATWAIDRSRRAGGAIFTSGTVGTSATSAFTPGTNTLTYTPGQQDVGNILQLISGTGSGFTASMYAITNATSTIYTLDRSTGATTATAISWSLGGSFATIGAAGALLSAVNPNSPVQRLYCTGNEIITSASGNVAGGVCSINAFGNSIWMEGFNAVCGDLLPGASFTASGISNVTILTLGNSNFAGLNNVALDGGGAGLSSLIGCAAPLVSGVLFTNFLGSQSAGAQNTNSGAACNSCYFYACELAVYDPTSISYCVADGSFFSYAGFGSPTQGTITNSIAFECDTIGGSSILTGTEATANNCVVYGSFGDGFGTAARAGNYINSIAYLSAGYGWNTSTGDVLVNCAGGANSSGNIDAIPCSNIGFVTLTSDPYAGNHIGGGTDLAVNATHNTWVTSTTVPKIVSGSSPSLGNPAAADVGLSLAIVAGTGFTPGIYKIIGFDSGTNSWILNASPAATSTTGGTYRIADFRPNNVAGGGAALRAAGIGPVGQVSYPDIGAVQHQDSGGGGSPVVIAPFGGSSSLLAM